MLLQCDEQPKQVFTLPITPCLSVIHAQVRTSGQCIYISGDRRTLETSIGSEIGGLKIADTDKIVSLNWTGPLWVIGSQHGVIADLEFVKWVGR